MSLIHLSFLQVYRFLSAECKAYLPTYNTVTIFHLRDIMSGKRTLIKCDEVKYINIPYYEGLAVEDIVNWAKQYRGVDALQSLPLIERELLHLPKEYISNCIYTKAGDDFQDWVSEQIEVRNAKVTSDKDLGIELDPAIA